MSDFMQPEITVKQGGWSVDGEAGTDFVPDEVCGNLASADFPTHIGDVYNPNGNGRNYWRYLSQYCENRKPTSIERVRGYFARLSAPGYMDCTAWACYATKREAMAALRG